MTDPWIRTREIRHVIPIKITSEALRALAEKAAAHPLNRSHEPFHKATTGDRPPVELHFFLGHDEEISARAHARANAE